MMASKKEEAKVEEIPCNLCRHQDSKRLFVKGGLELARCRHCGLVYANPRLTQEEIWKRYSPAYFWDEYMPAHHAPNGEYDAAWHRQRAQPVLDLLRPYRQKGRLLEVGCAAGFFLKVAQEDGWDVRGVEIMSPAVEYGRQSLQLEIFEGTLGQVQYSAGSFDVVVLIETLEHLLNPLQILQETYRLLRPGGVVWITVPNQNSIMRFLLGTEWSVLSPAEHLYYFTENTLSRMIKQVGFRSVNFLWEFTEQSKLEQMNPYNTHRPDNPRSKMVKWGTKAFGWLVRPIIIKTRHTDRLIVLAEK